ncbi:MAG: ABC transporter ATP-binding protein [Candidatus Pacebacteria bacterium]|nr:ABC transporter ATP-binding protein [Candidatus Paceibacterota bacterium]
MSFLEIKNLKKSYGPVSVLKDISLAMEEGGFLVLVGPSGCGKSTLLNTIAGLESITSGEIRIAGRDVAGLPPAARDIAMVFQSYALYPNMSVRENIAFGMEIRKIPKIEREKAINEVAEMLQISHLLDRKPSRLSGGQRQRVAIGRALVRNPQVFLFDEPLSNLDAKLRVDMRAEIKRLHQRLKTTIVYVTHDQIEAMTLATKIAVLKDGILQQFATPSEVYNNPANLFVADFMGSPSMNLIPVTVVESGGAVRLEARHHDGKILGFVPKAEAAERLKSLVGAEIILGIRPEAITDPAAADQRSKFLTEASCLIDIVEPSGADIFALTSLSGKTVTARLRNDVAVTAGQPLRLIFNLANAVYFDRASGDRLV